MMSDEKLVGVAGSVEWWECVKAWRTYEGLDGSVSMWLVDFPWQVVL